MMQKIVNKHETKIYNFLKAMPGLAIWALLLSPIWLGLLAPELFMLYITFLTVYWAYLAIKHTAGAFIGFKRYKEEIDVDWAAECKKLNFSELPHKETLPKSLGETKHFILIPAYSEPKNVLTESLKSLLEQTYPLNQITLVYTLEEKYAERVEKDVRDILGNRINDFEEVLFFVHPAGIPGEAKGVAGANRTWGAKNGVGHLKAQGKDIKNYIFTTYDSDSVIHPQFLARVTHMYLSHDKRLNKFFSPAIPLYNNNIWQVPMLMRIEAVSVTFGHMSSWITDRETMETFSCYSAALQTLIDANYWDVQIGVDDTLFFWRSFFAREGDFEGYCHFIPYSADAVQSDNFFKSHKSMYLQLRRWGWGTIAIPLSLLEFMKNKKIPAKEKIKWTFVHFQRRIMLITLVFLMTFGMDLLTFANINARQINLVYTLPNTLSVILTFALVFLIPISLLKMSLVKDMPKEWSFLKKVFLSIVEGPMVIVNLLTFSLIPTVDAYTRMLLGKRMEDLYHTPKVRTNEN